MVTNFVHDTQHTYRKILDSMSKPGKISSVEFKLEHELHCFPATFLVALTLFDAEVNFHVIANDTKLANLLSQYTVATQVPIEKADYIIVKNNTDPGDLIKTLKKGCVGTLSDPHQSATLMVEQQNIIENGNLELSGPGIKETHSIGLEVSEEFWWERDEKIKEYPLGIDLIFTDQNSNIVCIPRTTKVHRRGADR
ncbi:MULTISPECIES: phosphonate C-P lyase system protein PhnH [Oceanobacillus]|uniref:Phosphonate C-P lyase system protein PhnH n=1 Tax=Oceanobacillus kimchii TaxID=746691 RepID=A0ABQ5TI53_9BACI|nr:MULTISPECIES: phosphonate C-P lyase system protein PhnH [Oceanobacillus]MBT2599327.1 phosphonate C-P lyase system protein PhnH [Oceanobacillus sp. ISL-74]MBT2652245.1 phosphonate C-P lyase system protein PhnH [Oceanobacillus sp. ISL-73]OEH54116.1 phosphonate C-P lyase system protein PhnH [Oceanobacillus sp. E9]GLO65411.1 phosphonate C-P lyase system protein PhnH [Oceanobacillus kimchii]